LIREFALIRYPLLLVVLDLPRGASQLQDVHARIRAILDVDVAAVVHFDVIGLNGYFALLVRAGAYAALVRLICDRRNKVGDLLRMEWIAHVESAHSGVEMRDENDPPVINRREIFVARMCAKPAAFVAEIAAGFGNGPRTHAHRVSFIGDIDYSHHLPVFQAFIPSRLTDREEEVPVRLIRLASGVRFAMFHAGGG